MKHIHRPACVLVTLAIIGGCSSPPSDSGTATETESVSLTPSASHEQTAPERSPAGADSATGTVVETMDAASYTYARLDTGSETVWIAANRFSVAIGERLVVDLGAPMEDFHSPTLDRDFQRIYFVGNVRREGETAPAASQAGMPEGHPTTDGSPSDATPTATEPTAPIERPPGGTPIADIWANRAALAGTTVTVRGRVVKFNGGILGRNWLHLQDGSGVLSDGTHDVTVTTVTMDAVASVGDVVTVTGTVVVDRDFGAGYSYPVLLEATTLSR